MEKHTLHVKFRYNFTERWEDKDADYDVVLDHWPTDSDMIAACAIANSYEAEEVRISIDDFDQGHYYDKYQFANIDKPVIFKAKYVVNSYGKKFNWDNALNLMDDDIRETIHSINGLGEQVFFEVYCQLHKGIYGEEFELAKPNPVW